MPPPPPPPPGRAHVQFGNRPNSTASPKKKRAAAHFFRFRTQRRGVKMTAGKQAGGAWTGRVGSGGAWVRQASLWAQLRKKCSEIGMTFAKVRQKSAWRQAKYSCPGRSPAGSVPKHAIGTYVYLRSKGGRENKNILLLHSVLFLPITQSHEKGHDES